VHYDFQTILGPASPHLEGNAKPRPER